MIRTRKIFQILGCSPAAPLLARYLHKKGFEDGKEPVFAGLFFDTALAAVREEFPECVIHDLNLQGFGSRIQISAANGDDIDPYDPVIFSRVQAADRRFIRQVFGVRWDYYR